MSTLWLAAFSILILNLPFGYWRAGLRKLTLPWFLSIHIPVPIVAGIRVVSGLGWKLETLPVLVGAFFLGQLFGGKIRLFLNSR